MGQFYDVCPPHLLEWIQKQHLFWVATAPLSASGHVNVSPKGAYDCFHVEGPSRVWYEDLTGSGNETIAHLRENGRITVMFTAFQGAARIVRLFGTGTAHEFGTPEYEKRIPMENRKPGSRAIIVVDVHKVGSSCGYAVPFYQFTGNRTRLLEFFVPKEANDNAFTQSNPAADPTSSLNPEDRASNGMRAYWLEKNSVSIDGLPGVIGAPYARSTPQNEWSKERELERSRVLAAQEQEELAKVKARVNGGSEGMKARSGVLMKGVTDLDVEQLTRLSLAFVLGGLATASLVRAGMLTV